MSRLRKKLCDAGPYTIVNVPKRGYSFRALGDSESSYWPEWPCG
jgi:DNA-binding winged helix-turn-helix (wHTH) protein